MDESRYGLLRRLFSARKEARSERRKQPRTPPLPGTRMLIIDDSRTITALLGRMLQQGGYEVLAAGDAETGIVLAQRERPHLIFLDIVLPGMNGFAALRALRREESTRSIPIIMMSGNLQAAEQFYAQRYGADDFLKKPFPRAELFHKIARLVPLERQPVTPPHSPPAPLQIVDDHAPVTTEDAGSLVTLPAASAHGDETIPNDHATAMTDPLTAPSAAGPVAEPVSGDRT